MKLTYLILMFALAIPALADTHKATRTFGDSTTGISTEEELLEAEEYDERMSDEVDRMRQEEQERMENHEEAIDYNDRTRTNRARKAINTGSNASDDE